MGRVQRPPPDGGGRKLLDVGRGVQLLRRPAAEAEAQPVPARPQLQPTTRPVEQHVAGPPAVPRLLRSDLRPPQLLDARGERAQPHALVHVGVVLSWPCLLYTSPSPRDRTRSRMP